MSTGNLKSPCHIAAIGKCDVALLQIRISAISLANVTRHISLACTQSSAALSQNVGYQSKEEKIKFLMIYTNL